MGEHTISNVAKDIARRIGKDPGNFAAKSMRRSMEIHLAELGASITGFQMVGN